jgi:hypothetical protein
MATHDSRYRCDVLAASGALRVLATPSGELRLVTPRFVIGMDRETCEELTTTLARAVLELARRSPRCSERPRLRALDGVAPRGGRGESP